MGEKKKRDDEKCPVKVHIRLKKCVEKEGATYNIFADGTQLHIPNNEGRLELDRWYRFDHIYSAIASNKEVYRLSTYDLVESALKGINSSIFAYGQTGSGKTHTLMSKDGVTAHMISHLFNRIWKSTYDYKVTCSYFQIYNEHIYDLLNPQNSSECVVREDADRDVYVENVTNVLCETPMDVYELINIGRKSLVLAETKMNRLSCRSHAVCQLAIEKRKGIPRTKKRSMQETYSIPDILIEKPPGEDNKTPIDFATVPFNKADIRKRHSIAVTKVNDNKKSPSTKYQVPRSPSVSNARNSPNGSMRHRSNSLRYNDKRNRKNGSSTSEYSSPSDHLPTIDSPGRMRSGKLTDGSTAEISKDETITMVDSIGIENIKRLHDLYQSNIVSSDADNESISFESENSFTFSEGGADDYDPYYHEVGNGNEINDSAFVDGNGTVESTAESPTVRKSKISIIDLAGSERLTETNVDSERLKEAQNINLSLLELGNVISALASGKKKHIPYRNSVLTRLLQDSLGGNCKTKFLLCVSSKNVDTNETKSTLDFGQKLTKVFTKPILNLDIDYKRKYEQLLKQLKEKESNHETIKSELSDRISTTKEKIEEKESTRCGHEAMLNELQAKVNDADIEHEESKKKINTLRAKLVEQENVMKSKDEEISRLTTEFAQLLGKLEAKTMTNETSTLDATTNTPLPNLTLDFTDGSNIMSPVPNGNADDDADLTSSMECNAGSDEYLCDDVIEKRCNSTWEESNNAAMERIPNGAIDDTEISNASKGVALPINNNITNDDTSTNVVCLNHNFGRDIDVSTDVCTDANSKENTIQVTDYDASSNNIDMTDDKLSVQTIETAVGTTNTTDQGSPESVNNTVGENSSEKENDKAAELLDSTSKLNHVSFTKPANETNVNHSAHPFENTSSIGLCNDDQNSKQGLSVAPSLIINNKISTIDTASDVNSNITINKELPLPVDSMIDRTNAPQSNETPLTLENPGMLNNDYDDKYIINEYPVQTSTPAQKLLSRNDLQSEIDAPSSSLDYPHSSSQDSVAFTDVSEDSVIALADSSTNTDDDYVIDLYSPTPVETCDIATNTSDDEKSSVILKTNVASTNTNDPTTVTNPIVVTFVQSPKTEKVSKTSPGIDVGPATCDASTITSFWNIWSLYEQDENTDDNDLKGSLQTDSSTNYETIDTVRAAILVELSKLRHLYDLTKDSRYYLHNEFEMIGSIEGSNSSSTDDPEPHISDGICTVIHEIFALLPNILSESQYSLNNSKFSQEVIKTPEKSQTTTRPFSYPAPIALKYASTENQFEFLREFLKERKYSLEHEMLYIVTEMSDQNVNNDCNDHHRVEDKVSHEQLIEKLLHYVARGRSPQLENIEKLQNLLDMILCNHTVTSCLIALSKWPRLTKGQDIKSLSTAESEKHRHDLQNLSYQMAIETSPKRSVRDEDNANSKKDEHVKRRKGFLNKFFCMPSKSSKVKKSK